MRISIFVLSACLLIGCATKEGAPRSGAAIDEKPAPRLIWSAKTDKSIAEFGSSALFSSIAVSPDRSLIVSGDWDKRVILWDAASGAPIREIGGRFGQVTATAFSADGLIAFGASADRTLRAWEIASGKQIRLFSGHKKPIGAIAVDRNALVSGGDEGIIRVWNIQNGKPIRQIKDGRGAINAIAITSNLVVRGGADGLIKIYRLNDGRLLRTLKGHKGQVYAIATRNNEIFSGGADGTIRVWDVERGRQKRMLQAPAPVRALAVTDGAIVSGGDDMIVRFWDATSGAETHNFQTNAGGVNALVISGDLAVSASTKLQLFSAIDPNKISFGEIVKNADKLMIRENNDAIAKGESPESVICKSNEKRLEALSKALSIYWGDPRLDGVVYNDENQSATGFVRSFYGGFSRRIEFEISQDDAFELLYNPSYDPRVTFTLKENELSLETITIKDAWGEQTPVTIILDGDTPPLALPPLDCDSSS
ncbi:MAG: WD40 repeat domain-containing protein [Helicobacteraceae bacterium]|jgi:WD40 repeat protein|nr:WD40 repeat domain-containing protein [Helicobacteraceae bacterium]